MRFQLPIRAFASGILLLGLAAAHPADASNLLYWNETLLQCVRSARLGPPITARAMAIAYTCGYDAWACYDDRAVPTLAGVVERRPAEERTPENRERAFAFAFYRALLDLYPEESAYIRERFAGAGFDPDDASADLATPTGIGNVCAAAVTTARHGDGSNQLGDLHAGAYTDYTGYQPVNSVDEIVDPNRWQPQRFSNGAGGFVVPGFIAAHWYLVEPFALASADQFRPGPPVLYPSGRYIAQVREILRRNAHLDDRDKAIAEYWADGPRSELPPGHWLLFGARVSQRDGHSFDDDVRMFFPLANAMFDASIASWDAKRHYDYVRPITAVHFLYAGKKVRAYVPGEGPRVIDGADWAPYQPETFVTPPFPEYVSGHSTFSAAGAEILRRFTGSDAFGASVTIPAGSSKVEPGVAPSQPVTLSWDTFTDAADEAGLSRRVGGIHFEDGDLAGRALGRLIGETVWERARQYIEGTAGALPLGSGLEPAPYTGTLESSAGTTVSLAVPAPNPARGETTIGFTLARAAEVRLDVIDVRGRVISAIASGVHTPGAHVYRWSEDAPAGLFFVRLRALGQSVTRRVVLLRP